MNANVNQRPWVVMTYQCRFIDPNKCTTLVGDVGNRENTHGVGQGAYGKPLHLLLNFTVNLKLILKN